MKISAGIAILLGISFVGCKTTSSNVAASDDPRPKISTQKIYIGLVNRKVWDIKSGKDKTVEEGRCVTKISKDSQGNTVLVELGGLKIGMIEGGSKEVSRPDGYYDIDETLKIVETNFKAQPSVARLGFTRVAYELAKSNEHGNLEQYVVVKGMSADKIDVIEGYNQRSDYKNLNSERICTKNVALEFSTVEEALDSGLKVLAPSLPAASQKPYETKLRAMVAFVKKNGFDWQKRNDSNPPKDELTKLIDELATMSAEALKVNTKKELLPGFSYESLMEANLETICTKVAESEIFELSESLKELAARISGTD